MHITIMYKVTVGGFQRTTTDPMEYHNGMYFTATDCDNDPWGGNCALNDGPPAGG